MTYENAVELIKPVRRLCWLLILVFVFLGGYVFPKDWNGIVPCASTRLNAEKILGKDDLPINVGIYTYKKFRVHISYEQNDENAADKDIVEKIDVYPDEAIVFAKYIKRIPNFHRRFLKTTLDDSITHVRGRTVYRNWTEGFEIWVHRNEDDVEIVNSFGYFDPAWDCSKRKSSPTRR